MNQLLTKKENLLYRSNLRLIKAVRYSLEKIKENIELERIYISICTDNIKDTIEEESEAKIRIQLERDKRRKTLSKLKREYKKLKELTATDDV